MFIVIKGLNCVEP